MRRGRWNDRHRSSTPCSGGAVSSEIFRAKLKNVKPTCHPLRRPPLCASCAMHGGVNSFAYRASMEGIVFSFRSYPSANTPGIYSSSTDTIRHFFRSLEEKRIRLNALVARRKQVCLSQSVAYLAVCVSVVSSRSSFRIHVRQLEAAVSAQLVRAQPSHAPKSKTANHVARLECIVRDLRGEIDAGAWIPGQNAFAFLLVPLLKTSFRVSYSRPPQSQGANSPSRLISKRGNIL